MAEFTDFPARLGDDARTMRLRTGLLLIPLLFPVISLAAAEKTKAAVFANAAPAPIPLFFHGGVLACRGSIDGVRGVLLVDSGSNTTCLFARQLAKRKYGFIPVQMRTETANGERRIDRVVKTAKFQVGGLTYRAKNLVVLPDTRSAEIIGLLGCDFLTMRRMNLDLEKMRLVPRGSDR